MRRVVMVMLDGLRADQAYGLELPGLAALRRAGTTFVAHQAIFPSATRASSASVATGCWPARHGLHGNQMALADGDGFVVQDVGKPDFFCKLRAAVGRTLRVPTLAERVRHLGGAIILSNVSPGAALAHDPDGHGHVYHRAVSHAPGGGPVREPLIAELSLAGDAAVATRFIEEVLFQLRPAVALLWLGNPDDTQHDHPLGSPQAIEAIVASDRQLARIVEAVERLRDAGDDVLLIAGSDHGHETVTGVVRVEAEMVAAGFKRDAEDSALVVAPQSTGFLVYARAPHEARVRELAQWLATRKWCGRVVTTGELGSIGHAHADGLVLAAGMAATDDANAFDVPGSTLAATRFESEVRTLGNGSHGGFGRYETSPFLVIAGRGFACGANVDAATSLVDLAPSALAHLDCDLGELDGRPLQLSRAEAAAHVVHAAQDHAVQSSRNRG